MHVGRGAFAEAKADTWRLRSRLRQRSNRDSASTLDLYFNNAGMEIKLTLAAGFSEALMGFDDVGFLKRHFV